MKKGVLIIFILILSINFISSLEIKFSKENYQPQETLQAEITGNFISLTANNINIYKQGKVHPEPVVKDLTKQNNIYYFYAVLPKEQGNYTFKIEAEYLERGEVKKNPLERNLALEFKNTSDLSFNPGFIIPNKDFSIKVKSLLNNIKIKTTFELTGEVKEIDLIEQKEETINFKIPISPPQQTKIIIQNYQIPVFLIKKINIQDAIIEFIPAKLEGIVISENQYYFTFLIKNIGTRNLENINLSSNLDTKITPSLIKELAPNTTAVINLTISVYKIEKEKLDGEIIAFTLNRTFYLPIFFNITKNKTEINFTETTKSSAKSLSCSQLWNLCRENEICNGETVSSLEGACCIGSCIEEKKSSFYSITGIILLILLIIVVIYIILKVRQRKKIKSPQEILKESSTRLKKRMTGEESEEVHGRLDRI